MGRFFNPCTEAVQSCTGTAVQVQGCTGTGLYRYRAVQVQSCTGTELYRYSTMVVHVLYHSAVYYIHSGIVQEEVCMYSSLKSLYKAALL